MNKIVSNILGSKKFAKRYEGRAKKFKDEQTIELDAPPFQPRPGELLHEVIEGTGLPHREPVSMSFGNWKFDYNDIPEDKWKEAKPILEKRIKDLHARGSIRYGSW